MFKEGLDPEKHLPSEDLTTIDSYKGTSERVRGLLQIKEAVGNNPVIGFIDPVIVSPGMYFEFVANGRSQKMIAISEQIWTLLKGAQNALIVRRLFHTRDGKDQPGPRSPKITSFNQLTAEIGNIYSFFHDNYEGQEVIPEIMVHCMVDAGDPPKHLAPNLPFSGGAVVSNGKNNFRILATFGADESVGNFPADKWAVTLGEEGSFNANVRIAVKDSSTIADPKCTEGYDFTDEGEFKKISIPQEYQATPSLTPTQVMALVEACNALTKKLGPCRMEFDGTVVNGEEKLMIVEAAPNPYFAVPEEIRKKIAGGVMLPISVFNLQMIDILGENKLHLVYIPRQFLGRGRDAQDLLTMFAGRARRKNTDLVILAGTDIVTQHKLQMFVNSGHALACVEDMEFDDGELINLSCESGSIAWERDSTIRTSKDLRFETVEAIGGKAYGLAKLQERGFETSPFFVINTSFFSRVIRELNLGTEIAKLNNCPDKEIAELSDALSSAIKSYRGQELDKVKREIDGFLSQIGNNLYYVRSSATCEDSTVSFSGAFETVGNVDRKNLEEAISEVLASAFSISAIENCRTHGIDLTNLKMAIVVQSAVDSQKAGTMFTADPETKSIKTLVIEANMGVGEGIASGSSQEIHRVTFDRTAGKITKSVYKGKIVLTEEEALKIALLGIEIEESMKNGFQDIEWAIDRNGKVIPLQSRKLII